MRTVEDVIASHQDELRALDALLAKIEDPQRRTEARAAHAAFVTSIKEALSTFERALSDKEALELFQQKAQLRA